METLIRALKYASKDLTEMEFLELLCKLKAMEILPDNEYHQLLITILPF